MFHCGSRWGRGYAYAGCTQVDSNPRQSFYESRHYGRHRGRSGLGVRRPLRYLAYQLDLDEAQRRRVATALDALKTASASEKLRKTVRNS